MRFCEIAEAARPNTAVAAKLWSAQVKINQPNYVGYIEVTVTAPSMQTARVLLQAQYGVPNWHISSVKEVR